jgi:hypothetical protein
MKKITKKYNNFGVLTSCTSGKRTTTLQIDGEEGKLNLE